MPSRAVLRKKARREVKRQRRSDSSSSAPSVYYNGNKDIGDAPAARRQRFETEGSTYGRTASAARTESKLHSGATVVPARFQVPPPPKREPKAAKTSPAAASPEAATSSSEARDGVAKDGPSMRAAANAALTHKQRKKMEARLRLEKQMARLEENAARAAAASVSAPRAAATDDAASTAEGVDGDGEAPPVGNTARGKEDSAEARADAAAAAEAPPKMRHDPRFTNGTFWRDRKERRARTLFLGGVPARFTVQHVKDFVSTVVDTDPGALEYIAQLPTGTPLVEEVDMLPDKHAGKVRHMFVTMASVPIAFIASTKLDGMRMEQRSLRCNFASDKTQRSEAIKRRGPDGTGERGRPQGRGRGARGAVGGRGRGRGGFSRGQGSRGGEGPANEFASGGNSFPEEQALEM